jgi:hypothetical protein
MRVRKRGLEMKNVFVVAAKRNSGLALKSFHENICLANKAMLNTIDIDALQVIPAKIQFAKNGNVRLWCSVVA